jgi:hypothetical protein
MTTDKELKQKLIEQMGSRWNNTLLFTQLDFVHTPATAFEL